jgi:hypothetical protein
VSAEDQAALDRAAADMATRDDYARDAARLWSWTHPGDRLRVDAVHPELATLLDGLAEVYGLVMMTE